MSISCAHRNRESYKNQTLPETEIQFTLMLDYAL